MNQEVNGMHVENVTYKDPKNSLPKFVREAASNRGYGDATETLSLFINNDDIDEAFACAAHGDGSACVMAQAGKRIGSKAVYFFRSTAWIDFGVGPVVRYETSKSIYDNVIAPFDEQDRERVKPGIYHLTPPRPSKTISGMKSVNDSRADKSRKGNGRGPKRSLVQTHTERVVMASRSA